MAKQNTIRFELSRLSDYSNESILVELRRVAKLLNERPLSIRSFDKIAKVSSSTIDRRFGTWQKGLLKAGLDESYIYDAIKYSKEDVVKELKKVSVTLGKTCFSQKEFSIHSHISRGIFTRKYGSFNKVMNDAGLTVPLECRKYTDGERFENLLKVWSYYSRQPKYSEMSKPPSVVGPKTYVVRWGSWTKALVAFVEKVNEDIEATDSSNIIDKEENVNKQQPKRLKTEDKREIPLGLRFEILRRDKYKCVTCGRSPATTINIELHVDHIVPFSKGGKTRIDNLRTLCNHCNIGKSDKAV